MTIVWYFNRLSRMGPLEIAHRVVEQANRRLAKRTSFGWERFARQAPVQALPGVWNALASSPEPLKEAIRQSADRLLAGKYAALGVTWPSRDPAQLFPANIWRLDPVTSEEWPGAERFCFDIKYRHERRRGDIKYVWEFNRLQFIQPLAAAYRLFGDQAALRAVETSLRSWASANPPFGGLGWNSGIEVALRAVSILFALSLCGDGLGLETRRLAGTILEAHLYWVARFPSRFSSANNHLIAELMGEYLLTLALRGASSPGLRQALAREASRQILADGAPAEQSPTYGAFTAEMLLLCASAAKAAKEPLDAAVDGRLARFGDFVGSLCNRRAGVPNIGDDDEGRVLSLCDRREDTYAASVARAIAGHLGIATSVPKPDLSELRDGFFSHPEPGSPPPQGITTFPDGGYTIVRAEAAGRRLQLVLDHGPLGYLSIAAHGHADANSIILSIDDTPVFVDPGTYLYHAGHEWRDWFRGTRAHNTLTVGGVDQSIITGPFNWGSRAKAKLEFIHPGPTWSVASSHDGYRRRFAVDHRRLVTGDSKGLVIRDELLPRAGGLDAEITFQLAPGFTARQDGGSCIVSRAGSDWLALTFGQPGALEVRTGLDAVDGGWTSPRFGVKEAASRITWVGKIDGEGLETTIALIPEAASRNLPGE